MECNRDEAERAQSIAVMKFKGKEYAAARKFAVKAQSLYPDLKNIASMISMLDVYIVSTKNVEEVDHYALLNVIPSADAKTIRKQYLKLVLVHHPDKNTCEGADGAFRIIQESFNILSDQAKRSEYDARRAAAAARIQLQHSAPFHAQTAQNQSNGDVPHGNRTQSQPNGTSETGSERTLVPKEQTSATRKSRKRKSTEKLDTFWTTCNHCNFHYEFAMLYANIELLCDNCKKPFTAEVTAPPPGISSSKVPCQVPSHNAHSQDES